MSSTDNLFAGVLAAKTGEAAPAVATPATAQAPAAAAAQTQPDPIVDDEDEAPVQAPAEIDMLKSRARLMGLTFSNNIGAEALKAKINAKLQGEAAAQQNDDGDDDEELETASANQENLSQVGEEDPAQKKIRELEAIIASLKGAGVVAAPAPVAQVARVSSGKAVSAKVALRQQQHREQMKLVRLRITNLNPSKKDLPGEIFTVANRVLGAVRKFIPYGEATENGYHVPYWIYTQLKDREFLLIKTRKDSRGRTIVETSMAREFALEVLEPLTQVELARLAASQAAAAGME